MLKKGKNPIFKTNNVLRNIFLHFPSQSAKQSWKSIQEMGPLIFQMLGELVQV